MFSRIPIITVVIVMWLLPVKKLSSLITAGQIENAVGFQNNHQPPTTNHQPTNVPFPMDSTRTDIFMEDILKKYPEYFDSILQNRKNWNVQLIYTQVDRGANGIAALKNYYFNVNAARYFYPASTVKLPVSILAL